MCSSLKHEHTFFQMQYLEMLFISEDRRIVYFFILDIHELEL